MCRRHRFTVMGLALVYSLLLIGSEQLGAAGESNGKTGAEATAGEPQAGRPSRTGKNGGRVQQRSSTTKPASRPAASRPAAQAKSEVVAYYFHRTLRCPSCVHIETTAKQAIENRFATELKASRLRWESVDMQKQGNEHFVTDYRLGAPSLVLVKKVNGRELAWSNCEKVWALHRDEPAFAKYVQDEVAGMLSGGTATATRPAALHR